MATPGAESSDQGGSLQREKYVPKACEECRRRKQRCDGQRPCRACAKRSITCFYRATTRHRGRKPLFAKSSPLMNHSAAPELSRIAADQTNVSIPPRVHIFNNIRASHEASGAEAYYGASSNISLLLHIDDHLHDSTRPANNSDPDNIGDRDGTEAIRRYNYQNIAFDTLPRRPRIITHEFSITHNIAKRFLRIFLTSAIHRTPFLKAEKLCASLDQLYTQGAESVIDPTDRSIIIMALAIGATPTVSSPERSYLLEQAHAEAEQMIYDISLHAVQISLLMAHCEFENGNPSMCYLQLGIAIRKAFASGIHRIQLPEAEQTMWMLFCGETLVCVALGRPFGLRDEDVLSLGSEATTYASAFARLCIIIRMAYKIYCHKDTSVAGDLEHANTLHRHIVDFSAQVKRELDLDIGAQLYALEGSRLFWHVSLSYLYHFAVILVHRPFLVLRIEYERRARRSINSAVVDGLREVTTRCIESARSIVLMSESLFSLGICTEAIYNNTFHLESACFVLVLAATSRSEFPADSIQLVKTGLSLLQKLPARQPITTVVSTLEYMLSRLDALANGRGRSTTAGSHVGGVPDMSLARYAVQHDAAHTTLTMPSGEPYNGFEHNPSTLYQQADDLDDLWSAIDWNMEFSSLGPELLTTFQYT